MRISLCMIVKNEEKNIVNCLDRALKIVDEAIVVDTGSTDKTLQILKDNYGEDKRVRIIEYQWENDFSKARNKSLEYVTGDWILVLDADERIFCDRKRLEEFLNSREDKAYIIPIYNVIDRVNISVSSTMTRLFRNENPKYHGEIHEQIYVDGKNLLAKVIDGDVCKIYHYGYTSMIFDEKSKWDRNMEIIKAQIDREPDVPFHWYNKGVMEMCRGNYEAAIDDFIKSHNLTNKTRTTFHNDLIVRLIQCMAIQNEYKMAIEFIKTVINDPYIREIPDVYYYCGIIYANMKEYALAIEYFSKAIEKGEYDKGVSKYGAGSFIPKIEWAKVLMMEGKKEEAIEKYKEAVFDEYNVNWQGLEELKHLLREENRIEEINQLEDFLIELKKNKANSMNNNLLNKSYFFAFSKEVKDNIQFLVENGMLEDAKKVIKEYESIVENDADIYSIKGVIAMMEGKMDEAEKVFKKGILVNSKNFDLLYNLGFLLQLKEQKDLAIEYFKRALENAKNDKEMNIAYEILKELGVKDIINNSAKTMMRIQQLRQDEFRKRYNRLEYAKKQKLKKGVYKDDIHIVYVLTHVGICGGVKVILEHANNLVTMGVKVTLVCHFQRPDWFPLNDEVDYIEVPFGKELAEGIPDCDVIVATYWDHIQACIETQKAPVVYFEQGDFHLFDTEKISMDIKRFIKKQYELPKFIITVSHQTAKVIKKLYNREACVFHNSINTKIFNYDVKPYVSHNPYIMMMGSDQIKFKGIDDILNAYRGLKESELEFDLIWVTPTPPSKNYSEVSKVFVNPSQEVIAQLYRGAFAFISASHYEAFSLPVLEAMSCGCPVITTGNVGVREFAKDRVNALFIQFNNPSDIIDKVNELLLDVDLKDRLIRSGLKTSYKFSWNKTMTSLLEYYKNVAQYRPLIDKDEKEKETPYKESRSIYNSDTIIARKKKISLVYTSLSGSNTIALYKTSNRYIKNSKYDIDLVPGDMSARSINAICDSDIAVFTEGNYPLKSKPRKNMPIVIDLWHGFPLKAMGYADKEEKYPEFIKIVWSNIDYVTSYSKLFNEVMNKCFPFDLSKYIITGAQRNDLLFNSDGRRKLNILFNSDFSNNKLIFYMPTYRYTPRGNREEGNKNRSNMFGFSNFNINRFVKFLEREGYILFVKLHPAEENKYISEIPISENIKVITNKLLLENNVELYEILNGCDLMITDYSSVYFDLLLLDKPAVFTPIDLKEYEKSRGFLLEPYDLWAPGPKCLNQESLEEEIVRGISDKYYYKKEREIVLNKVHYYKDGNSSERTWSFIESLLD